MDESKKALSHLIGGAVYSCCNLFVGIILGLFLTPYLLSTLGERSYGIFVFAGLFTGWCGLVDFGLTTATSRFITLYYTRKDQQGLNETGNTALILFSILGLLVLAISGLTALFMKIFGKSVPDINILCGVVLIAGGGFAVSKLSDGVCGIINGTMRQDISGSRILLFRILYGLGLFVILYLGGRVIALVFFNFILILLQLLVFIRLVCLYCPEFHFSKWSFRRKRIKELLGYSLYTFITQVGDILIVQSDLLLIMWLFSMEKMARYNLVVVVLTSYYSSFMTVLTTWQTNWFTHLQTLNDDIVLQKWRRLFYKLATWFTIFMSFGFIAWGKDFIACWIGSEYWDVFPCLILCATASALCRGHAETNLRYLQGIARHKTLAFLVLFQGILNVILSLFFVYLGMDLFGIALGTVIPLVLVHHCLVPILLCRMRKESILKYYLSIGGYQIIALSALVIPSILTVWLLRPSYLFLLLVGAGSTLFYVLFLYRFGLNREDRYNLLILFRKKRRSS